MTASKSELPPPPLPHFWKMAVIGEWEIFTRNGGEPGMGGWDIFKVPLHSLQRGANPSYFIKTPYIASSPLFKFCPTPPPLPCQPPTPTLSVLSVVLFLWLNGWSRHIWFAITLVLEGPWCVFYATRRQVYRGLTHNVFTGTLIWYHTHKNTHSTLRGQ